MQPVCRFLSPVLAVLILLTGLSACNKNSATKQPPYHGNGAPHLYDINYYVYSAHFTAAHFFPGDTIRFLISGIADSFQLYFGDGTMATDSLPQHAYLQKGTYNVVLTKGADTLKQKLIIISEGPDSLLRANLARLRYWRYAYTYGHWDYRDTFAITLLGRGAIIVKGDTLTFDAALDTATDAAILFYHGIAGPPYKGWDFSYYYKGDSIVADYWYQLPDHPDLQSQVFWRTP